MPSITDTVAFVEKLFDGVTDKGCQPYAGHCVRVMQGLPAEATDDERHAALLHDVLEDTSIEASALRDMGYSERTVDLVERLSRRPEDGTYMEWMRSIAGSGDVGLIRIKLADNADNSDPARNASLDPVQRVFYAERYGPARQILEAALARLAVTL